MANATAGPATKSEVTTRSVTTLLWLGRSWVSINASPYGSRTGEVPGGHLAARSAGPFRSAQDSGRIGWF